MESLTVYGFGSYFSGAPRPHDIDLLLVHRSANLESCRFAIYCKAQIKSALPSADMVMLSEFEAESLHFVERAKAVKLEILRTESMDVDVQVLVSRLLSRSYGKGRHSSQTLCS
jgi:hypothetical protein